MMNAEIGDQSKHAAILPAPPTRIVGREREVKQLAGLLADTGVRLVTLTGTGGVGKTRLALEVAHRVNTLFADGVWWVDLAPLRDADQVLAAIASGLGVEADGERPLLITLVRRLQDCQALLVMDNIEQVPNIAPAVAELLAWCPALSILATGRAPLEVRAEQRYPVEPLSVPIPGTVPAVDELSTASAVVLFTERVQAVNPGFRVTPGNVAVVAEICTRLDGLPLAIELVAAQAHVLGLAALHDRLDRHLPLIDTGARDLPARQQTVEQSIAWSHDLLAPDEREVFRRLGVCAGGFSLEAADALMEDRPGEGCAIDVVSRVSSLVRQSLLCREEGVAGAPRFRMLQLTRAFALERLLASGEAEAVRHRHASCFLRLAQQAEAEFGGPNGGRWLHRLAADQSNLREALSWALEAGETTLAAQLAAPLGRFWYVRGHLHEGRAWLERVRAALGDAQCAERLAVLTGLGALAAAQGDRQTEACLADEAVRLARALGDERSIARSLHRRGNVARGEGELDAAGRYYEDALALFRGGGDRAGVAAALNNLGIVAAGQGDANRARALLEQAWQIYRQLGNEQGMGVVLCNLGQRVAAVDGTAAALPFYQKALPHFRAVGDVAGIAWSLQGMAIIAAEGGALPQAAQLYGAAEAHREGIGWAFSTYERREYEREVVVLREQLGEQAMRDAWAAGRALSAEQAMDGASAAISGVTPPASAYRPPAGLTGREVDVLRLVADGLTNTEIARHLSLSPHTIDAHLRRIYRKLEVRSRSAASRFAVEHRLV